MKYRKFGKLDWQASVLGFGCARFPLIDEDDANIDESAATKMVHYAIDHGVNCLDTAYPYHGGNSESFLGRALKGGYREKVKLATKCPCWLVESSKDLDKYLDQQLERLQTDCIDFYLLHGLTGFENSWPTVRGLGVIEWAEGAIADGRINHLGFSFHDSFEVFKEIVDAYDGWAVCQIQYNYMDVESQAGAEGLRYAASKGLAVVIMEPLLGGLLANPPESVQKLWDSAANRRTPADWALQWLWNQPEVSVVLSGMSTLEQVEQNVASANTSGVGTLTPEELPLFDEVREEYERVRQVPCTGCKYCMPCPNGVDIPKCFYIYNGGAMYGEVGRWRWVYTEWLPEEARADKCIQCRECEDKCPQHILISEWMEPVHAVLAKDQPYPERSS